MNPLLLALLACTPSGESGDSPVKPRPAWSTPPPSKIEAPERLVGFADVHGDLQAARDVLQLAGLADAEDRWIGGETIAVQTGDQLDRGDDERAILELFESLSEQAWDAGGGFYPLLGNHETMNVELDFRYVTDGGFVDFAEVPYESDDALVMGLDEAERGRGAAFRPGGPYAMMLAGHNLSMQVGGTVFVHGGILSEHAEVGLEAINADLHAWMRGDAAAPQAWIHSDSSPVWARDYSKDPDSEACEELNKTLDILGADRMVVGHTVQDGPISACEDKVWLMDVGMAEHYGGRPAALEIRGDTVTLIGEAR